MSPKKLVSLLPPKRAAKRDAGVNVRFTQDEYDELEIVADYRKISVTELVYHVVSQFALPNLREEMEAEIAVASQPIDSDKAEGKQIGEDTQPAQASDQHRALPPTPQAIPSGRPPVLDVAAQKQMGSPAQLAQASGQRPEIASVPQEQKQPQANPVRSRPINNPTTTGDSSN